MSTDRKPHVLYLYPGMVPPPLDPHRNKHFYMSEVASGDILLPVWWRSQSEAEEKLKQSLETPFTTGGFRYHFSYMYRYPAMLRGLARFFFFLSKGISLIRGERRYDAVITYGTNATGVAAAILSLIGRTKLIVEIPGVPAKAFVLDDLHPSIGAKIRKFLADIFLRLVLARASRLHLLYPTQLAEYRYASRIPSTVYHEFVAAKLISHSEQTEKVVYFLGSPWHLKGVDILIKAFRSLEKDFPHHRLKIVGHCPDQTPFRKLAGDSTQIDFAPGLPHAAAMEIMSRCEVFVLPSRTEAMGCVMLEAMAAGKPVIASDVDGIPYYLHDRENGLLFPADDPAALAVKLREILSNAALSAALAQRGRAVVNERYSEVEYARHFGVMLKETIAG